jgi:hypothetical protein
MRVGRTRSPAPLRGHASEHSSASLSASSAHGRSIMHDVSRSMTPSLIQPSAALVVVVRDRSRPALTPVATIRRRHSSRCVIHRDRRDTLLRVIGMVVRGVSSNNSSISSMQLVRSRQPTSVFMRCQRPVSCEPAITEPESARDARASELVLNQASSSTDFGRGRSRPQHE